MLRKICYYLLLFTALGCSGIELVKDGKACAVITVSENAGADVQLAARDLQHYLKEISGAVLPIVPPQRAECGNVICVGESSASRLAGYTAPVFKGSGYDILVNGRFAVLNGPVFDPGKSPVDMLKGADPQSLLRTPASMAGNLFSGDCGPMHAVSAFLEHLGVRFYAPGPEGTIVPKKRSISVADFRETVSAAFSRREYQPSGNAFFDRDTALWFRHLKAGSCRKRTGVLILADVMRAGEKQHPEWIAWDNGKKIRTNDGCGAPRLPSASLRQAVVRKVLEIFAADPELDEIAIQMPARRRETDSRDYRDARIPGVYPQDIDLNVLADFYRHIAAGIARVLPGKKIIWQGAFNRNNSAFLDNISNMTAMMAPLGAAGYTYGNIRRNYISQLRRLSRQFGITDMLQREWWNEYAFCSDAPLGFHFMHTLQEIRRLQRSCVMDLLMDAGVESPSGRLAHIPLVHLMFYINSKLLWDPDLDLDALLREYCTLWFGPAAAEMRHFLDRSEKIWADPRGKRSLSLRGSKIGKAELAYLSKLLEKAAARTPSDSVYRRRIAELEKYFSGLRSVFDNLSPGGKQIQTEIFPYDHDLSGNTGKYKKWYAIPDGGSGVRTEFALAFREDRKMLFAAFRCYEPEMKKRSFSVRKTDDPAIFSDDHVRVDFYTPFQRTFTFAANAAGSFCERSTDPDIMIKTGSADSWNPWYSDAKVRHFEDRWEAELAIGLNNVQFPPDWNPAWGLNASRIRRSGKTVQKFSLAPAPQKDWYAVTAPKSDCSGYEVQRTGVSLRPLPGVKSVPEILVKRASGKIDLDRAWDTPAWKNVPEIQLAWELWTFGFSSAFRPDVRLKMQYDDKFIYALFKVKDRYVLNDFKQDRDMVCLDSCVELFLQPVKNGAYFNIECNAIGSLLMNCISPRGGSSIPVQELKRIKRFSTLPRNMSGEIREPVTWQLGLQIPIDLIAKRAGVSGELKGSVWYGNVYKCADWSSHPHRLSWKRCKSFHAKEDFGKLIFE